MQFQNSSAIKNVWVCRNIKVKLCRMPKMLNNLEEEAINNISENGWDKKYK